MLAVLDEITNFSHLLGGSEHEKVLLPLLISFFKLDEKEVVVKVLSVNITKFFFPYSRIKLKLLEIMGLKLWWN